ncbi:MAG: glycosyltransferase family protein [Vicingaceae bacterium]
MKSAIIIQARTGSTRLPQKMILPFYKGYSLLELLVKDLQEKTDVPIILATTTNKKDDELIKKVDNFKINIFRGSEQNVLNRFIEAATAYKVKKIIRVCADNPFIQPEYINTLIKTFETGNIDYISFYMGNTPVIKTHLGLFAEGVSLEALILIHSKTNEQIYLEHVTNYIYTNFQEFKIKKIKLPVFLSNRDDLRFTLDTKEDFVLYQQLYEKYIDFNKDISQLISWIDKKPEVIHIMKEQIKRNSK